MRNLIAAAALCGLWLALWGLAQSMAERNATPARPPEPSPTLQTVPAPWTFPDRRTLQEYPGP